MKQKIVTLYQAKGEARARAMNLSELKPTCYELLRVEVRGEILCDIRVELRHNAEGPSRWRILNLEDDAELSCKGKWSHTRQRPKNLDYYRFSTPEMALEVWKRGVELPSIATRIELESADDEPFRLRFADALARIKAACAAPSGAKEGG